MIRPIPDPALPNDLASLVARTFRACVLVVGLFLILVVNREFGVADNGDFSRYIGTWATKPVDLAVNWPPADAPEYHWRFFDQPLNYWTATHSPQPAWSTSAALFWSAGNWLGRALYHAEVVNTRYSGLPFFLVLAFAFVALLRCTDAATRPRAVVIATLAALPMLDSRLTAFFNSYYGESVPLLAMNCLFAYMIARAFLDTETPRRRGWSLALGLVTVALLVASMFAKRQYLYFAIPALTLFWYVAMRPLALRLPSNLLALAAAALLLGGLAASLTISGRVQNTRELDAARVTSYHGIYYGLLPYVQDKPGFLRQLDLPAESIQYTGKSVWQEERLQFVKDTPTINVRTYLRAVALEPKAFKLSAQYNARQVGNFGIDLGMVYGAHGAAPPPALRLLTTAAGGLWARAYVFCGIVVGLVMLFAGFGLPAERRRANAMLAAILLMILFADVLISTFDGRQEARKHVLMASVACTMLMLQATSLALHLLLEWRAARRERAVPSGT